VALALTGAAALLLSFMLCIVACCPYPVILAIALIIQAALCRCALAIAVVVGVDLVPLAHAHAPAPALLSPHQSFLPSIEDVEGLCLLYGSIRSFGVHMPLAPICPEAP
jgi:hypothetical protein